MATRVSTGTAFVTVVALDKYGKSTVVPSLILTTEDDRRRYREGESRMMTRIREAGKTFTL
jgi:acyl-CoA hydrolase